ncbi:MAG TPA: DUF5818 domain-containing protein [Terriglobales bacterium]
MEKIQLALSTMLPVMALSAALCFASQPMFAQSAQDSSPNATTQQQPMQPDDSSAAVTTFSGKIVKSGDKLVLKDINNKTTYLLDDQRKAKDFLNQSVTVTGVLDASTGTIQVSAIEPV